MKRPYVISTIDFRHDSYGIVVTHKLCHILRKKGYECYVTPKGLNNKGWDTPTLYNKPEKLRQLMKDGAIAIYPEHSNNKLYSKSPVCWKLFPSDDIISLCFVWNEGYDKLKPVMYVEEFEHKLFNKDGIKKRKGSAIYMGKAVEMFPENIEILNSLRTPETIEITRTPIVYPRKRSDLAKILKRVEVIYTGDPITQLVTEARMCGCPVVYVGKYLPKWIKDATAPEGFSVGLDKKEVEKAYDTVDLFSGVFNQREELQNFYLDKFIEITQNYWINGEEHYGS